MQLYADALVFLEGREETVQECRIGEDGIRETTVSTAVSPMIVIDQAMPTCR